MTLNRLPQTVCGIIGKGEGHSLNCCPSFFGPANLSLQRPRYTDR
jgi:hypothetical protein